MVALWPRPPERWAEGAGASRVGHVGRECRLVVTVRVLVDSTADIPPERARELGIAVVPLTVLFGDESFRDGVDLDTPSFYSRLSTSSIMPTTSTPPPALFEEFYRRLVSEGATGILAMHIATGFSGTYQVSKVAADLVSSETGVPITVLDSRSVSGGYGLVAVMVAREAQAGASLDQITAHAESLLSRVRIFAALDTLEFLRRGGRIGRAQQMLGTMLNMKPILAIRGGQIMPAERVRTHNKAIERTGQLIAALGPLEAVAVVGSDEHIRGEFTKVAHTFWNGPIEEFTLGPVVGTHAGPGAGGIVAITRE